MMNYELIALKNQLSSLQVSYESLRNEKKELEKIISNVKEYSIWHVADITDSIKNCVDDNGTRNKNNVNKLKQDREYWKDVVKLCNNEFNLYRNDVILSFNSDN